MKKVILCVANDLTIDQRLHKVCLTLVSNGFSPTLLGVYKRDSVPLIERPYKSVRLPLFFNHGKLFYAEVNIRFFFYLLFNKVDIINANDLDTIIPCYLISIIKRVKLVYDSHEYFTEVPELQNRKTEKAIWTSVEEFIFPKLQFVSTVGNYIANEYIKKYNVDVLVVRNMPFKSESLLKPSNKNKILIYQGAVNVGRGIELMIEAMLFLPDFQLWIIGVGPIFKTISEKHKNNSGVKFFGKKSFHELSEITVHGMIGLSLEEDLGLNYRYALPNKIFDYVHAGIPVIVSDLPEMRSLVEEYKIGKILKERTPQSLAKMINSISVDEIEYQVLVENCKEASEVLNWERQEPVLLTLYN